MSGKAALSGRMPGEVQVWILSPAVVLTLAHERGSLPDHDRQEADRRPAALRQAFLEGRGALRRLLEAGAGPGVADGRLYRGGGGKPWIPGAPHFSVSHSQGWLGIAFCDDQPVGLDIELAEGRRDFWPAARQVFGERDIAVLEAAERTGRGAEAFLRAWTRLEARLKMEGCGFAERPPDGAPCWCEELPLREGLYGSVALRRAPASVRAFRPEAMELSGEPVVGAPLSPSGAKR